MIGTLIGETFKIVLKTIRLIPFIGRPITKTILFVTENLLAAIAKLPYVIGGLIILAIALMFFGVF